LVNEHAKLAPYELTHAQYIQRINELKVDFEMQIDAARLSESNLTKKQQSRRAGSHENLSIGY
jgi:phosphotransacetylase